MPFPTRPAQPSARTYPVSTLFMFPLQPIPPNPISQGGPFQPWSDPEISPTDYSIKTYPFAWDPHTAKIVQDYRYPAWFAARPNFSKVSGNEAGIPMWPLLPNERLVVVPSAFDNGAPSNVYIERTDIADPNMPIVEQPASTPAPPSAIMLSIINSKLDKIIARLGIV